MRQICLIAAMIIYIGNTYAQVNLDSGLVAYYPFNGNANDESGNGHDGTVFGATLTTDRNGNSNSAYSFDGIDDYIIVANAPELQGGSHPISVTAWFKADTTMGLEPIIVKYLDIFVKDWGLRVQNGVVAFSSESNSEDYICAQTQGSINTDLWYFAVFVAEEPNLTLYLDGEIVGSCSDFVNHWIATSADVEIGRIGYANFYFNGLIDDVRIYDRPLTHDEVDSLFGTITSINLPDPNLPEKFELSQNYPNPFNPSTTILYSIPKSTFVELKIFDIAGREVKTLVNQFQSAGAYSINFNTNELSSGLYIYRLQAENFATAKKMLFLR